MSSLLLDNGNKKGIVMDVELNMEAERAAFEKKMVLLVSTLERERNGGYVASDTHRAWLAWQAARATPPSPSTAEDKLRVAAQAVVDRWDTPKWKDEVATAWHIDRLRAALAAKTPAPAAGELPALPPNTPHVTRRIRRCESDVPAQLVLEHFATEYAQAAIATDRLARGVPAKAGIETAMQAMVEDAMRFGTGVMRNGEHVPFDEIYAAGSVQQPDGAKDLHDRIMNLPCRREDASFLNQASRLLYKEGHRDARHDAAELALAAPLSTEPQAVAVPDGWKLVPIEITHAMERAATQSEGASTGKHMESPRLLWRDMLAAAPAPAQQPENGESDT